MERGQARPSRLERIQVRAGFDPDEGVSSAEWAACLPSPAVMGSQRRTQMRTPVRFDQMLFDQVLFRQVREGSLSEILQVILGI